VALARVEEDVAGTGCVSCGKQVWVIITASVLLAIFEALFVVAGMSVMGILCYVRLILGKTPYRLDCCGGGEFIDLQGADLRSGVLLWFGSTIVHNLTI
jgi:hypothetical protein